eukprot:tig00021761_g23450.t1
MTYSRPRHFSPLFREIKNVRPKYETCCLTFGIFEYEAMDEDLDENGEICFNYCRLLRNISLECRKGDCFQHIMLNPAKNEITLETIEHVFYLNHLSAHRDNMATVRNATEIDPAKLAFEIDANGRIKAKYDGLQGLMMYAPPMVTINPCINTEQGKAWSDEKKAFVMEENGGFYTLDLTDLSAVDGQTNQPRTNSSSCWRPWTRNSASSLSKDQISVLQTPSVRIKVDKESGQAFYKYLNMRIRTQTMAGKRKTQCKVGAFRFAGRTPELAFKPYDNEADFEPYLNPESMYTTPCSSLDE